MHSSVAAILLTVVLGIGSLSGQTTITLSTSTNPAVFGQTLTLTATVNPVTATGKVTFYDGSLVLGSATLTLGKAVYSNAILQAGKRSLKAYYAGDATHLGASSPVVVEKVKTGVSNSFIFNDVSAVSPQAVAVGDFNADGNIDIAVLGPDSAGADFGPAQVTILLGNGDGTFS